MRNDTGFKPCGRCKETKPFADFPKGNRAGRPNHASDRKSVCKPCYVVQMREYYKRNPETYQIMKDRSRARRLEDPAYHMWLSVRNRAKNTGVDFTITPEDLAPLPEYCPAIGVRIDYGARGANNPAAASVDRIRNHVGYIPGNVVVVSFRANGIKRDASIEELRQIAAFYTALDTQMPCMVSTRRPSERNAEMLCLIASYAVT